MKSVDVCYISPIQTLHLIPKTSKKHLCLAHLLHDKQYVNYYKSRQNSGDVIIMDNSAFELGESVNMNILVDSILTSGLIPNYIVSPDFPNKDWRVTIDSLYEFSELISNINNSNNFNVKVMAVPQSVIGDVDGWLKGFDVIYNSDVVDIIGMSILGIPNAFCKVTHTKDISYNRIFATIFIMNQYGQALKESTKLFHYLGASDIREMLMQRNLGLIDSFDTSSMFWHGIHNIRYDSSASGLVNGKIQIPVDFNFSAKLTQEMVDDITYNIKYVQENIVGDVI